MEKCNRKEIWSVKEGRIVQEELCPYGSYAIREACDCVFCQRDRFRNLVREMGEWISNAGWPCQDMMLDSDQEYYEAGQEIINRVEVKKIMEGE